MDNSHWINFFTLDNVKKIHINIFRVFINVPVAKNGQNIDKKY